MVTGKPRCYQPQEFKDIAIQDLKTSDFTCQGTYVVLVLAGVVVCVGVRTTGWCRVEKCTLTYVTLFLQNRLM